MKLYSVRAHLHHYTELMDGEFIKEVCGEPPPALRERFCSYMPTCTDALHSRCRHPAAC
jgi:hypothetical protein